MIKDFKRSVSRKESVQENHTVITYPTGIVINFENELGDKLSQTINTEIPYISDVIITDLILTYL